MHLRKTTPRAGSRPMPFLTAKAKELEQLSQRRTSALMRLSGLRIQGTDLQKQETAKLREQVLNFLKTAQNGEQAVFFVETGKGVIPLRVKHTIEGKVWITQQPYTRGTMSSKPYDGLIRILQGGFKGRYFPNTTISNQRQAMSSYAIEHHEPAGITHGDRYSVQFMGVAQTEQGGNRGSKMPITFPRNEQHFVEKIPTENIVCVTVQLDRKATIKEKQEKRKFYTAEIKKKYGIPVKFIEKVPLGIEEQLFIKY